MQIRGRLLTISLLLVVLTGCGVKFWYNQLDWLVPWYIDDYVELNAEQQHQLEHMLIAQTTWHRSQQLPLYVTWIEQLKNDIESGAIHQSYDSHSETLGKFYQTLLEALAGDVAGLMMELDREQSQELITQLQQNDADWSERIQQRTAEENLQHRRERIADSLADWIGKLSKQQKALVADWVAGSKSTIDERLLYRARWRDALKALLALDYSQHKQKALAALFLNYRSFQSESLTQLNQHNNRLTKLYLLRIYDTLSARQKRRLLNKLLDYHEDFSDLAEDS